MVVLGSGGPEIQLFRNNPSPPPRASASYLVRENGKAAFLVDFGTGALQNFARSGAKIEDVKGILITHFHVDHINNLPALVKASFFSSRHHDLAIYGPTGNEFIPDTEQFITRLLGEKGAYSYLSGFLTGDESYQIQPTSVPADKTALMHFTPRSTVFNCLLSRQNMAYFPLWLGVSKKADAVLCFLAIPVIKATA